MYDPINVVIKNTNIYFSVAWLYWGYRNCDSCGNNNKKDDLQSFCYSNSCDCSGGGDREETFFFLFSEVWEDFVLSLSVTVIRGIARQRGVPGLSAVKLSISTLCKSGCKCLLSFAILVCKNIHRDRLRKPASSLGSRGQQQIQHVSTRHRV